MILPIRCSSYQARDGLVAPGCAPTGAPEGAKSFEHDLLFQVCRARVEVRVRRRRDAQRHRWRQLEAVQAIREMSVDDARAGDSRSIVSRARWCLPSCSRSPVIWEALLDRMPLTRARFATSV